MTYEEILDKWLRKLGRPCTAGEIVHDLRQLERPVRCKDCAHSSERDLFPEDSRWKCKMAMGDEYHDGDFFCAWGERREDG